MIHFYCQNLSKCRTFLENRLRPFNFYPSFLSFIFTHVISNYNQKIAVKNFLKQKALSLDWLTIPDYCHLMHDNRSISPISVRTKWECMKKVPLKISNKPDYVSCFCREFITLHFRFTPRDRCKYQLCVHCRDTVTASLQFTPPVTI